MRTVYWCAGCAPPTHREHSGLYLRLNFFFWQMDEKSVQKRNSSLTGTSRHEVRWPAVRTIEAVYPCPKIEQSSLTETVKCESGLSQKRKLDLFANI